MTEILFNTTEVAKMLQVDKSTVKRWTDENKIKCFRTPGGHRKFRAEDLYQFMVDYNYGVSTISLYSQLTSDEAVVKKIIMKKEYHVLNSVCFSSAIKGKKDDLVKLFTECYRAGMSLAMLFDEILKPTLKRINDSFAAKKISLSEIKLSSNAISSAIILLKDIVVRPTHNNKTIVCMSIENETNEIELRALEILLESDGYEVLNLGVGVPAELVNQMIETNRPYAVCVYSSLLKNEIETLHELQNISTVALTHNVKVIVVGCELPAETGIENCDAFSSYKNFSLKQHGQQLVDQHNNIEIEKNNLKTN